MHFISLAPTGSGFLPVRLPWNGGGIARLVPHRTGLTAPGDRSPNAAVRAADWKLPIHADGSAAEFCDLAKDAKAQHNLAPAKPEVTKRLSETALQWRRGLP